jgi:DNA recombination protein RmuC
MEIILFIAIIALLGSWTILTQIKNSKQEQQIKELSTYKGRFEQADIALQDLKLQLKNLIQELKNKEQKIIEFEKQNELLHQSQKIMQQEKQEWSRQKEKILFELSEELMRKNNDQQAKFAKNQEEKISKINENLYKNFENVLNKVSSLNDDVAKSSQEINLTKNALLNPSGVGKAAEITLENILKSSGLTEKKNLKDDGDYILQSHFVAADSKGRKPDAMIFLPNDHLLIIDSKSSMFFLELEKAKETEDKILENIAGKKLKETMRQHVEDLKKRQYDKAKEFSEEKNKEKGTQKQENAVFTTAMFLQTEKMLQIVEEIDNGFCQKALDAGILVITPAGLYNILLQAKLNIGKIKQQENAKLLTAELKKLIDCVGTMFARAEEIGKSNKKALKSYNDFATTFNSRFLVRIKNLENLGIESGKKHIGNRLEKFNILSDEGIIDGQIE